MIDPDKKLHIQAIDGRRNDAAYVYSHDQIAGELRLITTQMEAPVEGMTLRVVGEQKTEQKASQQQAVASAQGDDA